MDRKTMVASFDILSQNFKDNDPIAVDLRTMAYAISKMSDEEFAERVARKYETFPCPDCGTKVLKQTGYCVKCQKKVEPKQASAIYAAEEEESDEETEEQEKKSVLTDDSWNRYASEAVKYALVSDVLSFDVAEKLAKKVQRPCEPTKSKKSCEPECREEKAPASSKPVKKETAKKEDKESGNEKDAKRIVDTSILAFDGIELTNPMCGEDVAVTSKEKAVLNSLFRKVAIEEATSEEREKFDQLFK